MILVLLGKRKGYGFDSIKPHNITLTLLGTGILWFGWFGFNAGSSLAANEVAVLAFLTTFIAPAAAGLAWISLEWFHSGKPTALGFASGIIAGLVVITPSAGFVTPMSAIVMGLIGGFICYKAVRLKGRQEYDDSLDAFGVHGVGGITGAILTGLFASVGLKDSFLAILTSCCSRSKEWVSQSSMQVFARSLLHLCSNRQ